jgi:phosphoglycolate phosphatase-like HAD superfamily hydrolase
MATLIDRLGCRVALYIGDTFDDLRTVLAYRALPKSSGVTLLSAEVLTGTVGPDAPRLFAEMGTDLVAGNVNDVLRSVLPPR